MKIFAGLVYLACTLACVWSCDPDSDNKPTCYSRNVNVPIRNFWDPTAYWLCNSANAKAALVRCPDETSFFDAALGECVPPYKWKWTKPCPQN